MVSTPSLPSLPSSLCPGALALDKVKSIGQMELFDINNECKRMTSFKLNC